MRNPLKHYFADKFDEWRAAQPREVDLEALRRAYAYEHKTPADDIGALLVKARREVDEKVEAHLRRIVDAGGDPRDYTVTYQMRGTTMVAQVKRKEPAE